ncbi:MAG: hypothetical protein IPG71_05140 [bacterium]|nr:hypothetical protein [bacterium]
MKRMMLLCCILAVCAMQVFAALKNFDQTVTAEKQALLRQQAERELRLADLFAQITAAKQSGLVPEALTSEFNGLLAESGRTVELDASLDQGGETWSDAVDLGSHMGRRLESGSTAEAADNVPHVTDPSCYQGFHYTNSAVAPDVVYRWTAPYSTSFTFSLCGSSFDTELSLWNVTDAEAPTYPDDYICGNDDAACSGTPTTQSTVACIDLIEGQSIYVVVDGWSNSVGSYVLSIFDCNAPCAEAGLTAPGSLTSTNCGSGRECDLWDGEDRVVAVQIPYAGLWTVTCSITDFNLTPLCSSATSAARTIFAQTMTALGIQTRVASACILPKAQST